MKPSRVFRLIFQIFILLLTVSITVVSILGAISAVIILSNPGNLGVDPSQIEFNTEINTTTFEIENLNFTLPFNFTNAGYFDLENLELKIDLAMNYSHVDGGGPGVNETRIEEIFTKSHNFGTIIKGTTGYFNFTGLFGDFTFPPTLNFTSDVDWFRSPYAILFYANVTISLDYSIGLHSLTIGLINLPVGEIEGV